MKRNIWYRTGLVFLSVMLFAGTIHAEPGALRRNFSVGFEYFYGSLQPYGSWIEIDDGLVAWRPARVTRRWQPYTMGRWVYTANGWYWDSYEPYGWAVYHYGRWYYDDYYGWMWLPDDQWGPAWVEWRYDDNYIGWAPLPPYATFSIGIGIRFTRDFHYPVNHWHYVEYGHFDDYHVHNYFIPEKHKYRIHGKTKYRGEYEYRGNVINRGVDRDYIEKRTGRRIPESELYVTSRRRSDVEKRDGERSNSGRIEVFRPDDSETKRYRDIDRNRIERADRKTGLRTSEVTLRGSRPELGDRKRENKPDNRGTGSGNERNINQTGRPQVRSNRSPEYSSPSDNRSANPGEERVIRRANPSETGSRPVIREEKGSDRSSERIIRDKPERKADNPAQRSNGNQGRGRDNGGRDNSGERSRERKR